MRGCQRTSPFVECFFWTSCLSFRHYGSFDIVGNMLSLGLGALMLLCNSSSFFMFSLLSSSAQLCYIWDMFGWGWGVLTVTVGEGSFQSAQSFFMLHTSCSSIKMSDISCF